MSYLLEKPSLMSAFKAACNAKAKAGRYKRDAHCFGVSSVTPSKASWRGDGHAGH